MVHFSEIQQFPDFLELFPGNFRTICLRFETFGIFGRMVSALVYPKPRTAQKKTTYNQDVTGIRRAAQLPKNIFLNQNHNCFLQDLLYN